MKVKKLIERLQQLDQEREIYLPIDDNMGFADLLHINRVISTEDWIKSHGKSEECFCDIDIESYIIK